MMEGIQTMKEQRRNWKKTIRNGALVVALLVAAPITANLTAASEQEELQSIQHIYINDQYIGKVSGEKFIEETKEQLINEASEKNSELHYVIKDDVKVVPEMTFTGKANNKELAEDLRDAFTVEAQAHVVKLDDYRAMFVKDEAQLQRVLHKMKLDYVSEEDLKKLEQGEEIELNEQSFTLVNLNFSHQIVTEPATTTPTRVVSDEELYEQLKNGVAQQTYVVQDETTWEAVAEKHDLTAAHLQSMNPSKEVTQGTELIIQRHSPKVTVEQVYEMKEKVDIPFEKVKENDATILKGEEKVAQQGKNGVQMNVNRVRKSNGERVGTSIANEEIVTEPVPEITKVGTKEIPSRGTGTFAWPAVGGYISSGMGYRWGRMHEGIDIARPSNHSILAADNGTVKTATGHPTYGNYIVITHNNGYETLYGHLSSIQVRPGQVVSKGTKIGVMGSTGRSTGVHLHFEVRKNGALVNPLSVLR